LLCCDEGYRREAKVARLLSASGNSLQQEDKFTALFFVLYCIVQIFIPVVAKEELLDVE
jgi:hypothetical protein